MIVALSIPAVWQSLCTLKMVYRTLSLWLVLKSYWSLEQSKIDLFLFRNCFLVSAGLVSECFRTCSWEHILTLDILHTSFHTIVWWSTSIHSGSGVPSACLQTGRSFWSSFFVRMLYISSNVFPLKYGPTGHSSTSNVVLSPRSNSIPSPSPLSMFNFFCSSCNFLCFCLCTLRRFFFFSHSVSCSVHFSPGFSPGQSPPKQ